jgi:hypothetical protein
MKTIAIVSALASVALAQSVSGPLYLATASYPTDFSRHVKQSALIPSGISDGCSKFLTSMNSNSTLSECTTPLISATSAFGPGGSSSASSASVTSALSNLCAASTGSCSDATIRDQLTQFYAACSAELTSSPNPAVVRAYDVLYALTPLKKAVCAKDDSGKYCVSQLSSVVSPSASASAASASASSAVSGLLSNGLSLAAVQKYLWTNTAGLARRADSEAAMVPNTTTYAESNLLFLFLQPTLDNAELCTSCTRTILTSYIDFESDVPYAPGLGSSPMMSGQTALYNGVQTKCGSSFLSGAVQAAGSLSNGLGQGSGAVATMAVSRVGVATAALGVVVFGAFAML